MALYIVWTGTPVRYCSAAGDNGIVLYGEFDSAVRGENGRRGLRDPGHDARPRCACDPHSASPTLRRARGGASAFAEIAEHVGGTPSAIAGAA